MYTTELNLIPDDVYARLCSWLHAADLQPLKLLNGDEYSEDFPPYLSSIESMIGQQLRLGGKARYGQFPRHAFTMKGASPFILPQIQHAHDMLDSKALHNFFTDFAAQATALSSFYSPDSTTSATIRDMIAQEFGTLARIGNSAAQMAWFDSNINQRHRAAQLTFIEDGFAERINYAAELLSQYCYKRGLQWSLRPPIAFQSTQAQAMYARGHTVGIHDATWFMSPAMHHVLAATPKALANRLYDFCAPYHEFNSMFRFWEHRAAYGLIWQPATGDSQGLNTYELAIVPRSTPACLYSRFDLGIPLYSSIAPGLSPSDSHARVVYGDLEGEYRDTYALTDSLSDSHAQALAVLNYVCLGYSIFVATIPMGKGNHKPSWTNSPLNTSLIRALHAIQRPLLERFRSII